MIDILYHATKPYNIAQEKVECVNLHDFICQQRLWKSADEERERTITHCLSFAV